MQDHLNLVDKILTDLHTRYTNERLSWQAEEIQRIRGYAGLAVPRPQSS